MPSLHLPKSPQIYIGRGLGIFTGSKRPVSGRAGAENRGQATPGVTAGLCIWMNRFQKGAPPPPPPQPRNFPASLVQSPARRVGGAQAGFQPQGPEPAFCADPSQPSTTAPEQAGPPHLLPRSNSELSYLTVAPRVCCCTPRGSHLRTADSPTGGVAPL